MYTQHKGAQNQDWAFTGCELSTAALSYCGSVASGHQGGETSNKYKQFKSPKKMGSSYRTYKNIKSKGVFLVFGLVFCSWLTFKV